jgi:AcrR family transcriptional regulator
VREIKDAALDQLVEVGPGALSLRGVARAVGMTVQSLYHYFPGRDALLTALVADAHHDLADAVQAAADTTRGRPAPERRRAALHAFRRWALDHRARFLLLYGTPVPGFVVDEDGGTQEAALRLAAPFVDTVFDGWTPAELAAVPAPPGITDVVDPGIPLPTGALAWLLEMRARMHGMVTLELLGHLQPLQDRSEELFAATAQRMAEEIDAEHARARAVVAGTAQPRWPR